MTPEWLPPAHTTGMSTHPLSAGAPLSGGFPVSIRLCDPPLVDLRGDDSRTAGDFGAVLYARSATAAAMVLSDLSWSAGKRSLFREAVAGLGFDPDAMAADAALMDALLDVRIDEEITIGFRHLGSTYPGSDPFTAVLRCRYQGLTVGAAECQIRGAVTPTWVASVLDLLEPEPAHRNPISRKRG